MTANQTSRSLGVVPNKSLETLGPSIPTPPRGPPAFLPPKICPCPSARLPGLRVRTLLYLPRHSPPPAACRFTAHPRQPHPLQKEGGVPKIGGFRSPSPVVRPAFLPKKQGGSGQAHPRSQHFIPTQKKEGGVPRPPASLMSPPLRPLMAAFNSGSEACGNPCCRRVVPCSFSTCLPPMIRQQLALIINGLQD